MVKLLTHTISNINSINRYNILDNIIGEIYEGQFVNGDVQNLQLEEKGEVIFKNGAVYKGQWLGDMKHGYGV